MGTLIVIAMILLSPALLAGSLLFAPYWVGQYRLLRRTGSWARQRERQERWRGWCVKTVLTCYALILGALLFPGVFPRLSGILLSGYMLGFVGLVLVDFAVLVAFSPDRAMDLWKAERKSVSALPP